jgi:hypothetical protein
MKKHHDVAPVVLLGGHGSTKIHQYYSMPYKEKVGLYCYRDGPKGITYRSVLNLNYQSLFKKI